MDYRRTEDPGRSARICGGRAETVLTTQLTKVIESHAHELIGQDDIKQMVDQLGEESPSLIESVVPKLIPFHNLTAFSRSAKKNNCQSPTCVKYWKCCLSWQGVTSAYLIPQKSLRPNLVLLLQRLFHTKTQFPVVTLEPSFENILINTDRQNQQEELLIDANLSQNLITKLSDVVEEQMALSKTPFLIVSPIIRRKLAKLVRAHMADLNILSFTELLKAKVDVVATITGPEQET